MIGFGIAREQPFDTKTVSETKRASAARSIEAAMAIGVDLYRQTGSDEDAAAIVCLMEAHADVTGSPIASVKTVLRDASDGTVAQLSAVAHKSLAFLDSRESSS